METYLLLLLFSGFRIPGSNRIKLPIKQSKCWYEHIEVNWLIECIEFENSEFQIFFIKL